MDHVLTCIRTYHMVLVFSITAPSDYASGPYTAHFHPNSTSYKLHVPITSDLLCERREYFSLKLNTSDDFGASGVKVGESGVTTVWILDDDGEWILYICMWAFAQMHMCKYCTHKTYMCPC